MHRLTTLLLFGAAALAALPGCPPADGGSEFVHPPLPDAEVLATVNGVPITEEDVRYVLALGGHDDAITPVRRANVLETIIRDELLRQRAVELGLDADPRYQEKLRRWEAQLAGLQREELADVFYRREVADKATPTDEELRAYFEEHEQRIRTELHVYQILRKSEAEIEQAHRALQEGQSFEEVAASAFARIPETGRKPWDLGTMRWSQVPEAWRDVVYDLEVGETSGIIRGPGERYWIVQLIDRRYEPDITFDSVRAVLEPALEREKIDQLRQSSIEELRAAATIEYAIEPASAAATTPAEP